jgi:AAA domain
MHAPWKDPIYGGMSEEAAKASWQAGQERHAKVVQKDQTSQGYPFKTFDEMALESVAKRWLIKGIFARGESSAWIAPPGGMKSALMASAAIHLAAGLDWFGHRNKEAAGVVYFAIERADLVRRRLQAHGIRQNLKGLPIVVVSASIDLTKLDAFEKVIKTIREVKEVLGANVGLVIIDTFAKLIAAAGGDENSAKDQGAVFANVQRVKNSTDAHVALVSHTGKDESRGARGSNAILGDVDVMVTISGDLIRTATVTKANDAPEGALFSFKSEVHEFGTDEDGDPISVNVVSSESVDASQSGAHRWEKWPKGLKLVHEAITGAVTESGMEHRVGGDGPSVRAATVTAARAIHRQRYVSNGDGDRIEAERKAWARSFKTAREANLVSGELREGQELIWLVV